MLNVIGQNFPPPPIVIVNSTVSTDKLARIGAFHSKFHQHTKKLTYYDFFFCLLISDGNS